MKNHTDSKESAAARTQEVARSSLKEQKLAQALRRNLQRRKQADSSCTREQLKNGK